MGDVTRGGVESSKGGDRIEVNTMRNHKGNLFIQSTHAN